MELLVDVLQGPSAQEPGFEADQDRIAGDVHRLADREIPALRKEVADLSGMLADTQQERRD